MNNQLTKSRKGYLILPLIIFSLSAATAFAQITVSPKAVQLAAEKAKLDAKRDVAYDMGVNIAFGVYQAEVTQTEFPNKNSKIYGPAMNLRSQAFGKARTDAETINAILSAPSDKLDIQQFLQYSDGFSHEKDALTVALGISLNIKSKLSKINSNLAEAFTLGYHTDYAEANASGGESRRSYVGMNLDFSNEKAKQMKIYNEAGGTLAKFAKEKVPVSEIYPKIVSLRTWYAGAVKTIK